MQRKEELLTQLDNALKRKVQEKFMKTSKQESDPLHQQFYGVEADRSKFNSKLQVKNPSNNYASNISKSPAINSKQAIVQTKSQHNINLKTTSNHAQSPKLRSERQMNNMPLESSNIIINSKQDELAVAKMKEEIKKLKGRNIMLQNELKELKSNIAQLQQSSKSLKRQESQYLTLKQENMSLVKQIQFFKNKMKKQTSGIDSNQIQSQLKKILFQLNISSIHKLQNSQKFISQSLRSISQGILKLSQEKNKISTKINNFDIQTLLLKQNNTVYRKQLEVLRTQNEQLQSLIEQNCTKIEQLQQSIQHEQTQNKKLQSRFKQVSKELDSLKRQFRMTIQASKHTRPKRQSSAARQTKESALQSLVLSTTKLFNDQQCQTQTSPQLEIHSNDDDYEIRLQQQQQIQVLNKTIEELHQNNLKNDIEKSRLQQQCYKYEQYIKELQYKSEEIQKDLNNFMPQLKEMQEENNKLKHENLFKDELIQQKQNYSKQMKSSLQKVQERASTAEMQLKKQVFQNQLLQTNIQNANTKINSLSIRTNQLQKIIIAKENEFNNSLTLKNTQRQNEQNRKIKEFQKALTAKNDEITKMMNEWNSKERQYTTLITKLQASNVFANKISSEIVKEQQKLMNLKQTLEDKLNLIQQKLSSALIKSQQYASKYKLNEHTFKQFERNTNHLLQTYASLEKENSSLHQQKKRQENINQTLTLKIDELTKQMFAYKCDIQRLTFDNKNNSQLKQYYQQVTNELKSKLDQLIKQITKVQGQKSQLLEKQVYFENNSQQVQIKQAQIQHNWEQKNKECEELKVQLNSISSEYHLLSQQFIKFRNQSGQLERSRLEQISLQNYDIERLVRQCNELKLRIQQLSSLRQSNLYKSSQADQRIVILTEQNRSLFKQNQMLIEQLRMKQANIQQDQYLSELKNRQYCILLKKMLSGLVQVDDLEHYDKFEELLEIGAEMTVKRKIKIRNEQSQNRRKTTRSEYELQYISEPIKRFYIGTQISSSEEIMAVRHAETDQILEMESNITKDKNQMPDSPRSFKFSPSPLREERIQKRKERLISYFNNSAENQSKIIQSKEIKH